MELLFNESEKAAEEAGVGIRKCGDWVLDILTVRCLSNPQVEVLNRWLDMSLRFPGEV